MIRIIHSAQRLSRSFHSPALTSRRVLTVMATLPALLLLNGCLDGQTTPPNPNASSSGSLSLVTYDTQQATLLATGMVKHDGVISSSAVKFFTSSNCTSNLVGQGKVQDLLANGVKITVPSTQPSSVYLNFAGYPECMLFGTYSASHAAPPPPTLTSTVPGSPSLESNTPRLFGAAAGVTASLAFYDDAACSHLVGTGTAADFALAGISVTLAYNAVSAIYVRATEPFGNVSACAKIGSFTHTNGLIPAPSFAAVMPLSPNNKSTTPTIKGTAPTVAKTISIFADPACATELGSATYALFTTDGLQVTVPAEKATGLYAIAYDSGGKASACTYMTTYIHDTVAPAAPSLTAANPASPTNKSIYPMLTGTASSDTARVILYNDILCTHSIGSDTKAAFESSGVRASVTPNAITAIYAAAADAAGNLSTCTPFQFYVHNTIPPDPPVYDRTSPLSPNNKSIVPLIFGDVATGTVQLNFYQDENCTLAVGSGSASAYQTTGIQLTVPPNNITPIYAQPIDIEGNIGACTAMTNYAHSDRPAAAPGFLLTMPQSPSRVTNSPMVLGTAAITVSTVDLYDDAACTNQLAHTSRSTWITNGVQTVLPQRANTPIYGQSTDVYGNTSACTFLTSFIHDDVPPLDPIFVSVSPLSPNNQSTTPVIIGTSANDPFKVLPTTTVSLYDSFLCLNRIGTDTRTQFIGAGTTAVVPPNSITSIFARSWDNAGNSSGCVLMTSYTHDTWPPGKPILSSANPDSPSYTRTTILKGTLGSNKDLLPATQVVFYSDAICQTQLGAGPAASFTSSGIAVTADQNTTTTIYAATFDQVGNTSACTHLIDFVHNDIGPANLIANANPDGSIGISWNPDMVAYPTPNYILKRSLTSGGPYTVITPPQVGNSFVDRAVSKNTPYYYVVAATNSTGTSFDSNEATITVAAGVPQTAVGLYLTPSDQQILLHWSGFNTDMSFKVYRSLQAGGPYTLLKSGIVGMSHTDKHLTNGTVYYYLVVGTNPEGDSVQSVEVSAVPHSVGNGVGNLVLTPLSTGGACGGGTGIRLTWSSPPYYDGFVIRRSISPGAEVNAVNIPVGTNSYVECPNFGSNLQLFYTVAGTWNGQNSADSNEVGIANTSPPALDVLGGATRIRLSWQPDPNATSFKVYRATKSGGPYTLLDPAFAGNIYDDPVDGVNVIFGNTYFYYVQGSYPNSVVGYPSLEGSAKADSNPNAPSNLIVMADKTKNPALFWSAPKNFNYFKVYRSNSPGGPWTFAGSTLTNANANSFIDSPMIGLWYYQVTAVWGSFESAPISSATGYRHGYSNAISATPAANNIALSWSPVTGAASYKVYRSTSNGGFASIANPATTTYTDSTAAVATGYFYYVTAIFADSSEGEPSLTVSGMRTGSTIPTGLTINGTTSGSIDITWAKVASAASYKIYKSTSVNGTYILATTTAQNSVTVSGLLSGLTYFFKVTAVVSGAESAKSTPISGTTLDQPNAPSASSGNNQISVCWSAPVVGATSYTYERTANGTSFTPIATGATTCPVLDNGVTNGNLYFYRVTANFPGGGTTVSPLSAGVTPGVTPLVPQGLTMVGNSTGTDLTFNWSFIPGATDYMIYVSTTSGSGYTPALLAGTTNNTNVTVTALNPDTTYYFVVTSRNGSMESGYSNEIAVTTAATPSAPTVVAAQNVNISVVWAPVPGAVAYDLERSTDGLNFTVLSTGATSPYVDATPVAGVAYFYRYQPYTDMGRTIPMAKSAVSSPGIVTTTAPLAPQQLTADVLNTTSINLNWGLVPNSIYYRVYQSATGGAGTYSLASSVTTDIYYMPSQTTLTVAAGATYYLYVVAVNDSGVESSPSNVVSVTTGSAPTTLTATSINKMIQLSWDPVGGAASYIVRRGLVSGGPFGVIASGVAGTSYNDTDIVNGITYIYVVDAVLPGGIISADSNEATATGQVLMNLQVPIELTDQGLSSSTTPVLFERTRSTLDTSYYDGTVTYTFEINALNFDTNPVAASLIDKSGTSVASLMIAGNTTSPFRTKVVFAPTAGANEYRLQLDGTSSAGLLRVLSARVLITQVNASRTRIYIPLTGSNLGVNVGDASSPLEATSSMTYASLATATLFTRNTTALSNLADSNAWELETLAATYNGAIGTVAFYNESRGTWITETQGYVSGAGVALIRSPFPEGVVNFDSTNEGDNYGVSIRCEVGCLSGGVRLYKAGLWATLTSLKHIEVFYRVGFGTSTSAQTVVDQERTRIDLSSFSNGSAKFRAVGTANNGSSATLDLVSLGTNDQGTATPNAVAGSTLSFSSSVKLPAESAGGLSITNGDRYAPQMNPGSDIFNLIDSTIVIDATP